MRGFVVRARNEIEENFNGNNVANQSNIGDVNEQKQGSEVVAGDTEYMLYDDHYPRYYFPLF